MTATASGNVSAAAVLNPVNPSIATASTPSRNSWLCFCSQVVNTALERPETMSNNRAGPVPSRTGVRSMMTVTNRSAEAAPARGWRQQCSSTPRTRTPSNLVGSSINSARPVVRTASLAVCHDVPRLAATRVTETQSMTTAFNAHNTACRDSVDRGAAAVVVSCRHTCPHPGHR